MPDSGFPRAEVGKVVLPSFRDGPTKHFGQLDATQGMSFSAPRTGSVHFFGATLRRWWNLISMTWMISLIGRALLGFWETGPDRRLPRSPLSLCGKSWTCTEQIINTRETGCFHWVSCTTTVVSFAVGKVGLTTDFPLLCRSSLCGGKSGCAG